MHSEKVSEMAKKRRVQIANKVVEFAADTFVDVMVAGFSYGIEIRAQIFEDLQRVPVIVVHSLHA